MTRMARTAAIAAAIVVAAVVAFGALLTSPSVGTPFARMLLGDATLARAWVSYTPGPVAHLRAVEIADRGHAEAVDAHLNPFGVLPGIGLIRRLTASDGALLLELGPSRRSRPPRILDEVAGAELTRIRLDVERPEREPQVLNIGVARGDLESGAFTLQAEGGSAVIEVEGKAAALSLAAFEGRITAQGDNFAELAALLGFAAPDTPPYRLAGELRRLGETWRFAPFEGQVGDSDLAGELAVDFAGERPLVLADLKSKALDFDDLGVVVGAPSDLESGAPNARQQEIEQQYERDDRAIPDTELDFARVRAVDAEVTFVAESVRAGSLPLEGLTAEIALKDAVLTFERLLFTAPQGRLEAEARIDARNPEDVQGELQGALSGFELAQIGGGRILRGTLLAEFDVSYQGSRTRQAFASMSGEAAAWSTDAEIRALVEEGAGLDIGEVLRLLMTEAKDDPKFRRARCLAARIPIHDGVATLDPAVLDTADSVTRVDGDVDLSTEEIDLDVSADAKDVSWGALLGGAEVAGTLRHPRFAAPFGGPALQGGAAAVLGGLTAGLAALPFIELGLGEDAPCAQLLAAAEAYASEGDEGAPADAETASPTGEE